MNTNNCKEELIDVTIALINENGGNVNKVTIRDIASRSGVSVGLINYHFGSKDRLVVECVQKIIAKVVKEYRPDMEIGKDLPPYEAGKARLTQAAKEVFYYMYTHKEIAKISILSDYERYTDKTSSYFSLQGFSNIIGDAIEDPQEKERVSFMLTSSMQVALLKVIDDPIYLGYDFSTSKGRGDFITHLMDTLMRG